MRNSANMGGFDFSLSPLTKRVIGALIALYIAQLLLENWVGLPMMRWFAWWPWATKGFLPWQPFTCYLLNGPTPMSALFDWLFLFFFLTPVEQTLGRRGLLRLSVFTIGLSAILGFLLNAMGAVGGPGPFLGLNPILTAMLVIFGLSRPNAQILLFFVLPIKAAWLAWGTGLLALLNFLASRDLDSTLWLSGWIAGYLWIEMARSGGLNRWWLKQKQRRVKRRLQRFEVIEGEGLGDRSRTPDGRPPWGRSDDDDGPLVH